MHLVYIIIATTSLFHRILNRKKAGTKKKRKTSPNKFNDENNKSSDYIKRDRNQLSFTRMQTFV